MSQPIICDVCGEETPDESLILWWAIGTQTVRVSACCKGKCYEQIERSPSLRMNQLSREKRNCTGRKALELLREISINYPPLEARAKARLFDIVEALL